MRRPPLTTAAIDAALDEFDAIGREAFLELYGYRQARSYFLIRGGKEYDSKAIVGAAHGKLPGGAALTPQELNGGHNGAAMALKRMGYNVQGPDHDWTWDEHVLALDLYLRKRSSPPGKDSAEIDELSKFLNHMADASYVVHSPKFRNRNGVYMKLMNFRRLDPTYQDQGKSGLTRGAEGEKHVWDRYADDPTALAAAVAIIRGTAAREPAEETFETANYYDLERSEGSIVLRMHLVRERSRELIKAKKQQALAQHGRLACECCAFDFATFYGAYGSGYAEVHHTNPIALSDPGRKTKLSELAIVCANCHRMLHHRELIALDELRAILHQQTWAPA